MYHALQLDFFITKLPLHSVSLLQTISFVYTVTNIKLIQTFAISTG